MGTLIAVKDRIPVPSTIAVQVTLRVVGCFSTSELIRYDLSKSRSYQPLDSADCSSTTSLL